MSIEIFDPCVLAGIKLKNRIIRSATHEGMSDENGQPTQRLKELYVRLAKGEVGAIITGYAGVGRNGKSSLYRMQMADEDTCISHYKSLVDGVHQYNTPIILQIAHCGRQTRSKVTGFKPVAPSALRDRLFDEEIPQELCDDAIEGVIDSFVNAVMRAKSAGFDAVQLHMAHGYLLSEFLSPAMNHRVDKWGGDTENRYRIIAEIFKRVQAKAGNFPILVKINAYDNRNNGMRIEEAIKISKLLEKSGCAAIEVSCGVAEDGFNTCRSEKNPMPAIMKYNYKFEKVPAPLKPLVGFIADKSMPVTKPLKLYNVQAAAAIKKQVSVAVIAVGGIGSLADIRDILDGGKADFVSMSRPFIIEPDIVKKFKEKTRGVSLCQYCNYCMMGIEAGPLRCFYGKLK